MSRTPTLRSVDANVLQSELRRRQRRLPTLQRKRAKLMAKVSAIDNEIALLGGATRGRVGRPPGPGRTRPKNESNLIDALAAVLKDKTMGVAEAMEAVQKAGYRSSSPNFKAMVNGMLIKKKHFRRVERGRYTAK
jgi:hypothetical protein